MTTEYTVIADAAVCTHLTGADSDPRCLRWDDPPDIERPGQLLVGRTDSYPDAGVIAYCATIPPAAAYERGLDPIRSGAPAPMALTLAGLTRQALAADGPTTDHLLILTPDGQTERVGLLPRPLPRDPAATEVAVGDDLAAAIAAAERAIDPVVGIIESVGEEASVPLPYYLARLTTHPMSHAGERGRLAAGVDLDWDRAYMRALGEALERYAASVYNTDALQAAPPDAMTNAMPLDALVRPAGGTPDLLPWVSGLDLHTRSPTAVPAGLVYHPPPGPPLRPAITTGLALARTRKAAIHRGLLEVIERDAVMRVWYGTAPVHRVTVETGPMQTLTARLRAADLSVACWGCPTDEGVPVCIAAVHRTTGYPYCAFGTAAAVEPREAATHAVIEATQNWMELEAMGREASAETYEGVARYAEDPSPAFAFLPGSDAALPVDELLGAAPDAPEPLIEHLAHHGLMAVAVSVTTGDLRALGFEAVRVVIPAAQPLFVRDPYFGDRVSTDAAAIHDRRPHPFP